MTANVNNLTNLTTAIMQWTNRNDPDFIANIPLFISLAEQEFFIDCPLLGTQNYAKGNFIPGVGAYPKPSLEGQILTFSFVDSNNNMNVLNRVGLEYIYTFVPNPNSTDPYISSTLPQYYTEEGFNYLLVSPTPQSNYQYQFVYYTKITPLSPTQSSNWITLNAYDTFFYNCMHKAFCYLESYDEANTWKQMYLDRVQNYKLYDRNRNFDRSTDVAKGQQ